MVEENLQKAIMITPFKVLAVILLAISMTLLFLAVVHEANILLASLGRHGMVSVIWNN
jgi:hypothetical protein